MKFSGIKHVLENNGDVLGRFSPNNLPLYQADKESPFPLLKKLRALKYGETGSWNVSLRKNCDIINGRVCAIKRSPEGTAEEEAKSKDRKQQISGISIELCGYILIFTSLPDSEYSPEFIVKVYRLRWQIEILFKRLKSLLEIGHLHKYDALSIEAYLNGKILISLLIEKMIRLGDSFSPLLK